MGSSSLRARLRAKVAADTKQNRHVMNQTSCERRHFPVPLRWLHAGGDLSRHNHANQRADRPLIRSTRPPNSPLHASRFPLHTHPGRPAPASRPPPWPARKSNPHSARCPAEAKLPATSCLGAFWTPAARVRGASRHPGVQKPAQELPSMKARARQKRNVRPQHLNDANLCKPVIADCWHGRRVEWTPACKPERGAHGCRRYQPLRM